MSTSYRHTILNVDDDEGARYAKTRIFERAGYRVLEAATGGDALRLVHEQRPHLVLLDVGLPNISGIEIVHNPQATAFFGSAATNGAILITTRTGVGYTSYNGSQKSTRYSSLLVSPRKFSVAHHYRQPKRILKTKIVWNFRVE